MNGEYCPQQKGWLFWYYFIVRYGDGEFIPDIYRSFITKEEACQWLEDYAKKIKQKKLGHGEVVFKINV